MGRPTGDPEERTNLLADDSSRLWDLLRTKECSRLPLLADNAGTELLMDLALVDYLLCQDLVEEVQVHLKPCPFFVSYAMAADVWVGLSALGYLGCAMERRSLLDRGWVGAALSSGLDDAARADQPSDVTVIRSVLAKLYGQDPARARAELGR